MVKSAALVFVVVLVGVVDVSAQPCASRKKHHAETSRDGKLVSGKLVFCTDDQCWSMDPASRSFTAIATIAKQRKSDPAIDSTGRAKATTTGVEFCPTKDTCKSYKYKFKFQGSLTAAINTEGTLGAVTYEGNSMDDEPTWVMLFDLSKPKAVKRLKAAGVEVFGNVFWVDDTFYSPAGKKLGKLSVSYDSGPVRIAKTDLVAVTEKFDSRLSLIDVAKHKIAQTVKLGLVAGKTDVIDSYLIVSSDDGAQVHVIAGGPNTGEVITIETATGKQVGRSAPPICADK